MQTRFLAPTDGTLAYSGSGQLALMLPGMGALRSEYRYLAPKLSEAGFRALSVDLRGQGESSVPWKVYDVPSVGQDILALIENLDAGPAHLIGTSFAGATIVWAAAEYPEYVRSIVLVNSFVRDAKPNPYMAALFWLMLYNPWRVRTWSMYYGTLYPTQKPPDFNEYIMRAQVEPGRARSLRCGNRLGDLLPRAVRRAPEADECADPGPDGLQGSGFSRPGCRRKRACGSYRRQTGDD
jgi:pimeloyl-ACP methyl ester carboxylesterase